ncbi:outer membrane beta-barrel protein [Microbulbifer thermotolerans]|uniref:Uncharacterized protein n=1 Tax=Microbulbifer thermotolerans TaxID=252514 RepID=A0A143HPY5_MICTH|nr:outer membrane beta-barrel protein [Microbulbifer thermotolerans]AMX03342.1 hypothetical protein A3224_12815 [Microbulbifer thermotolerans]MCX2834964.1 outer membrane beta-barrel protein [Microbulbifer thermotolerans]WKT59922.1 outer membrane beta-barrel protein [Microbulbifer thermotolerans]SFC55280.1 Outer membrane protein beta-barrel domain-containing protein [Microbulbifer thermotolerans]
MKRPNVLLAVFFLVACAQTQADFYSHKYGGIGYGNTELQGFCNGAAVFVRNLNSSGQTASASACGEKGDSWKIYTGWRWTPYMAVEASYQQLAKADLDFRIDATNGEFLQFEDRIKTHLLNAFIVGHCPLFEGLSLFGKLGGGLWSAELSERQSGQLLFAYPVAEDEVETRLEEVSGKAYDSDNGFHWGYGFGIDYRYRNKWTLRAEWESFTEVGSDSFRSDFDAQSATLGWSMHF